MVKNCGYHAELVLIGAKGTGLGSLGSSGAADFRCQVQELFYELSNEWLNQEVGGHPLWDTFYADEDLEPLAEQIIACVINNICSERNIPVSLMFQCLQVCLDYLKVTETQGYFVEIGSFIEAKGERPVWYRRDGDDSNPRIARALQSGAKRFCGNVLRVKPGTTPLLYWPDIRHGADMQVLMQTATNKVSVLIVLEILHGSDTRQVLTYVAQHFLKQICLEQPVLKHFGALGEDTWAIKTEQNKENYHVDRLLIRGYLPAFNPIFAGITARGILESCYFSGATIPVKLSVELNLDK